MQKDTTLGSGEPRLRKGTAWHQGATLPEGRSIGLKEPRLQKGTALGSRKRLQKGTEFAPRSHACRRAQQWAQGATLEKGTALGSRKRLQKGTEFAPSSHACKKALAAVQTAHDPLQGTTSFISTYIPSNSAGPAAADNLLHQYIPSSWRRSSSTEDRKEEAENY